MSTRCQVRFKEGKEQRMIYVHSDGYPQGMMPLFNRFLKLKRVQGRFSDIEYLSAMFCTFVKVENVFYSKNHFVLDSLAKPKVLRDITRGTRAQCKMSLTMNDIFDSDYFELGVGICDKTLHTDIEFLYEIDLKNMTCSIFANSFKNAVIVLPIKNYQVQYTLEQLKGASE